MRFLLNSSRILRGQQRARPAMAKRKPSITPYVGSPVPAASADFTAATLDGPDPPPPGVYPGGRVVVDLPAMARPLPDSDALLTLQLSSPSFLDSVVLDDFIRRPLYLIETAGRDSTISRADPNQGVCNVAVIRWPSKAAKDGQTGIRIQMHGGKWEKQDEFFNCGALFS